jgi:HD-GYP domain-containing protein (c-di-GMP phosphodiesterase class II)
MGQEREKAIRAAVVAVALARRLDLAEPEVADVYWTAVMRHLGCTATPHEEGAIFGPDDLAMRRVAERTDDAAPRELLGLLAVTGAGAGLRRPARVVRALTSRRRIADILRATCEVGAMLAERLGLGETVARSLAESLERWDGKGAPQGLRGDRIAAAARIAEPATQAVIFHRLGGADAALAMAARRSGGWFDPAVAEALRAVGRGILERLEAEDPWELFLEAEPEPVRRIPDGQVDRVAEAFADMVDLKTPFTLGHSAGVAGLAAAAAERLGFPDPDRRDLRRAALLHDLGRVAVPVGVWERPGPLRTADRERVRLHPYHTERILDRSGALRRVSRVAGMHHERQDGSGYHHGAAAAETPAAARLLAAADAFHAMTEPRPHRPARSPEEAADLLGREAAAGRFDPECVRAVLEAAGNPPARARTAWPAGLSEREVEVLRLVAAGLSNREVAGRLFISPRTAEHHVQHVYAKIGVSTRAAAAMFAMEHGLIRDR